jgi:hypothetical protein
MDTRLREVMHGAPRTCSSAIKAAQAMVVRRLTPLFETFSNLWVWYVTCCWGMNARITDSGRVDCGDTCLNEQYSFTIRIPCAGGWMGWMRAAS